MNFSENTGTLDDELSNVKTELSNAVDNLKHACSTLRELSIYNGSPGDKFVTIHQKVVKSAYIYRRIIFPFAQRVVSCVKDSLDNFEVMEFEDFKDKDTIKVIVDETAENRKLVQFTKELHIEIYTDFNRAEDDIKKQEIENENLECDWIENLKKLKDTIKKFINGLSPISSFFTILENHLYQFGRNSKNNQVRAYFIKCQNKAKVIIRICTKYLKVIPSCEANLKAINIEVSGDCVEFWLLEKKITNSDLESYKDMFMITLPK